MGKHFDFWSLLVMAITLALFVIALFTTGFTHDLFLEAGVFLVSVKLILMSYKNSISNDTMQRKLDAISRALDRMGNGNVRNHQAQSTQSTVRDRSGSNVSERSDG